MTLEMLRLPAYDGSGIDGSLFTDVTDFARDTHWLNGIAQVWTTYSIGVFVLLLLVGWWISRRKDDARMTAALTAPICVVVAFLVTEVIKSQIAEVRPCRSLPADFILESCPVPTDYALPSGHTTFAMATAVALLYVDRRLGVLAVVLAVLEGASRVYVGAHYPHDVLAAIVVAVVVVMAVSLVLRHLLVGVVGWLRRGPLRPLLVAT